MSGKKKDAVFLAAVVLFWFAQYIFTPFLTPHLLMLGVSASFAGVIVGAYGFAQLLLRIPLSVGEDCLKSHRLFMAGGFLVLAFGGVLPVLSSSPYCYLLSRALAGAGAATWVSYTVFFTEGRSAVNERMGKLITANNLGILLSYLVGGWLYQPLGILPLFLISAGGAVLGMVLVLSLEKGSKPVRTPFQPGDFLEVLKNRHLWLCSLLATLSQLVAFATAMSFVTNYAQENGADGFGLGLISMAFYGAGMLPSWMVGRGLCRRFSERGLIAFSFFLNMAYCLLLPFCHSAASLFAAQAVGGIGRSLLYTLLMASAPSDVPDRQKSTAMGVFQSVYSIGMAAGPALMGWILDSSGSYFAAFFAMAAFSFAGVVWTLLRYGKKIKA